MFSLPRFKLISLVLPLFFSLGASALPSNYRSAPCTKKEPDEPTYWQLAAVPNTDNMISQRMKWVMSIDDADGVLRFSRVKLRVVHMPANATSSSDRKYEYPVLDFRSGPGSQFYTFDTPGQGVYSGYFAYIDIIDFLDDEGSILASAHVDSGSTINSGGIQGIDYRRSTGKDQINMATGWELSIADNSYMFDSTTPRFQITNYATCDEHEFNNIAQGDGMSQFSVSGRSMRGTNPTIYMTSSSGTVNSNWNCNYTLEVRGLKIANNKTLLFDRKGFNPIRPNGLAWDPNKWPYFHNAYFNLRTSDGVMGNFIINDHRRSARCHGHG